jgi:hypothetical protein
MKYRIASQKKGSNAVYRPAPAFDNYEDADTRAKELNGEYPDRHHWAEPAPDVEPDPNQIGRTMVGTIVGESTVYKHPDGPYEHVIERPDPDWPSEIDV